jgi:hypothetical protein
MEGIADRGERSQRPPQPTEARRGIRTGSKGDATLCDLLASGTLSTIAQLCEAGMLICFGCSWPAAILKTLRVKRVEGKSIHFLFLVFIGYLYGIAFRILTVAATGEFKPVLILYFVLALLVSTEIVLYFRYRKRKPVPETATIPPVE